MTAIGNLRNRLDNYESLRPGLEYEMLQMYDYGVVMVLKDAQTTGSLDTFKELSRLADIRRGLVSSGYDNKYVINKIPKEDIELMKANDADSLGLASRYMKPDKR